MTPAHPDDETARAALRAALIQARRDAGLSQRRLASRLGILQASVAQFERHPTGNVKIGTAQRYARGCEHRLILDVRDLPAVDDDPTIVLYRTLATSTTDPAAADAYHRAAIREHLRVVRLGTGRPAHDYGPALGCGETAVLQNEAGRDDPLLATYQRWARVLGGYLHIDLQPIRANP